MTNEPEKQFFDTFGIRAYYKYLFIDKTSRHHNEKLFDKTNFIDFVKSGKDYLLLKVIKYYPEITDRILLELICLCPDLDDVFFIDVKILKETLLKSYINIYDYYVNTEWLSDCGKELKQQVCTLFKENV